MAARTLHLATEDLPWAPLAEGMETRIIHARLEEGYLATQVRAHPGVVSQLHRHGTPVIGYTTKGAWGHDRRFEYRPGTYIFETPGVLHRFLNGPNVSEVFFNSHGDIEMVDPETKEVVSTLTPADRVAAYFSMCEELDLPRPNVLT